MSHPIVSLISNIPCVHDSIGGTLDMSKHSNQGYKWPMLHFFRAHQSDMGTVYCGFILTYNLDIMNINLKILLGRVTNLCGPLLATIYGNCIILSGYSNLTYDLCIVGSF